MNTFELFDKKMRDAGMGDAPIAVFRRNFEALQRQETGTISEQDITSAQNLPALDTLSVGGDTVDLSEVAIIKLNGGLGTGMGLQGPKTLLPIRSDLNFLDLLVQQVKSLQESKNQKVRLLLMNSFSTSESTLNYLSKYETEGFSESSEVELMQHMVPKIDAETLAPAKWDQDPSLEWCPPGHGDIYPALVSSGWLDKLLADGVKYAFVSNSDNLGAVLDERILSYFASSEAPFMMEVTRRTAADRKGGHLALRKKDQRLLLREVAQCLDEDLEAFQDISKHQYFNTNSLWLNLEKLKGQLTADGGVLPLPMITNRKTVDPRDGDSPAVFQLEIAMGSAIECFEGALAIDVPRSRFAPVKTSADLLALRSDAYVIDDVGQVRLHDSRNGVPPNIKLSKGYKLVDSLDQLGVPSLINCDSLTIEGSIAFAEGVKIEGDVTFENTDSAVKTIAAGTYKDGKF